MDAAAVKNIAPLYAEDPTMLDTCKAWQDGSVYLEMARREPGNASANTPSAPARRVMTGTPTCCWRASAFSTSSYSETMISGWQERIFSASLRFAEALSFFVTPSPACVEPVFPV